MTFDEVMAKLSSLSNPSVLKHNTKSGVGENQFGVKSGDLRAMAKEIKANPELAEELWQSGNLDAMMLATLIMKPKQMSTGDFERLLRTAVYPHVVDWLNTNVIKPHPQKESVRETWMNSDHEFTARVGWSLTTERVCKNPDGLDLSALLDRIEKEMAGDPTAPKWTMNDWHWSMNCCLAEIGIKFPEHRARATAIGEKIGAFRDFPASKGCVSPYAPSWIAEMVRRSSQS